MEQVWLLLSLASLVTGFGLMVALLVLKRLAPVPVPPVLTATLALLLMGVASLSGVYLRILGIPRSIPAYRVVNAFAWGYAAFAMLWFAVRERTPERRLLPLAFIVGAVACMVAFLAAHPSEEAVLGGTPSVRSMLMIALEALVGAVAVWAGVRALVRSRGTTSRPWRAYLRGFGAAVLVLVPVNLVDFAFSLVLQARGFEARDGLVYAAGYAVANIVLIVTIVRAIRLSADGVPAVPQAFLDVYGISPRERDVVEKLVEGKSDRRIAEELFISPRTVDTHLRSVFRKCNVSSRLQLSRLVVSYGELRSTS
jgi:DNA-binding CsgD family transcriptional regulator